MKVLAIAATDLRLLLRWRMNIFFLFVLPMLIILLLGVAFGGSNHAQIGIVTPQTPLARQFVTELQSRPATNLHPYTDVAALQRAVARGNLDAGLVLPAHYDRLLESGKGVTLSFFARPASVAQQLRTTIQSVADQQSRGLAVALLLVRRQHIPFQQALARSRAAATGAPVLEVKLTAPDGSRYTGTTGRFDAGASAELLLFIFLTSLNATISMIETRRLGITRRILSTPTSMRVLVGGQVLGRFAIALVQALIIILGSLIFFGVHWGNPLGTAAVVIAFCLVSTGVAVLLGSLFSNGQQAGPVAMLLGLGLAALGGSMAPLEIFPKTARTIAHITPHAWANDAFSKLLKHGGDLVTVLPQVGVLFAFAAVTLTIATWQLRRSLTS
jgi:ABC-2 type transport system permease protein